MSRARERRAAFGVAADMHASRFHLVGFAGSLRSESFNRALLRAAGELLPDDVDLTRIELADVPPYNADLDTDEGRPEPVARLKRAIAASDGVLVVTPEYNYGMSGVLKNALDWVSRPGFASPLNGRPVGIIGASSGASGTMRAQEQVKVALLAMLALVFPHRGFAASRAAERFDDDLRLTDEPTRTFLRDFLEDFVAWARRVDGSA